MTHRLISAVLALAATVGALTSWAGLVPNFGRSLAVVIAASAVILAVALFCSAVGFSRGGSIGLVLSTAALLWYAALGLLTQQQPALTRQALWENFALTGDGIRGLLSAAENGALDVVGPEVVGPESTAAFLLVGLLALSLVDQFSHVLDLPGLAITVVLAIFVLPALIDPNTVLGWGSLVSVAALTTMLLLCGQQRAPSDGLSFGDLTGLDLSRSPVIRRRVAATSSLCVLGALGLGALIPLQGNLLERKDTPTVSVENHLNNMNLKLADPNPTGLLKVTTKDPRTQYVRLTVLDDFDENSWGPAPRSLSTNRVADGREIPTQAPGLGITEQFDWELEILDFNSKWLPLPQYPTSVTANADWRFDDSTLDFVNAGPQASRNFAYQATAAHLEPSADILADAGQNDPAEFDRYLSVPASPKMNRISRLAKELTKGSANRYEQALALQQHLRGKDFTYSLVGSGNTQEGLAAMADFLFRTRTGFCEQFATSMATMARTLGIPSRIVVGFRTGTKSGDTTTFSTRDLHAWPELHFPNIGWIRFEPTPSSHTEQPPSWTPENNDETPLPGSPEESASPSGESNPSPSPSSEASDQAGPQQSAEPTPDQSAGALSGWESRDLGEVIRTWVVRTLILLTALSLLLLPAFVRWIQRRRRLAAPPKGTKASTAVNKLWHELAATRTDLGQPWSQATSVRQQAALLPDQSGGLEELLLALEESRYAPRSALPAREWDDLATTAIEARRALLQQASQRQRLVAIFFPRSIFTAKGAG